MILFECDLDNTIIHSYKKADENDICIEIGKDGKKLSYMTQEGYNQLNFLNDNYSQLKIIPVTTRSIEQYLRINLFKNNRFPEYAVTSNGGNLLVNNIPDEKWFSDSLELIEKSIPELKKSIDILNSHKSTQFEARFVDELFVFTKSDDIEDIKNILEKNLDGNTVSVFENGQKIYVMPKILSKGTACKRLYEKFKPDISICAGDSSFDIPMLEYADIAIYPSELDGKIHSDKRKIINDNSCNFAEFICANVRNICGEL